MITGNDVSAKALKAYVQAHLGASHLGIFASRATSERMERPIQQAYGKIG
jgi:hypothetical protein